MFKIYHFSDGHKKISKMLLSLCLGFLTCVQSLDHLGGSWNKISRIRRESKDPRLASGSCALPDHPDFGQWSIHGTADPLAPGQLVANGTILSIVCNKHYIVEGSQEVACQNGTWSGNIGRCSKTCPPRKSTDTIKVTCIYRNRETENCTEAVDGTLSKLKCAPFYENTALVQRPVHLCQNGTWNQTLPRCVPVCGGSNPRKRTYPWHALIYQTLGDIEDFIPYCSGSLISPRIVLTSAFWVDKYTVIPLENYTVAVGKHHQSFNDSRDRHAQYSKFEAVFIHPIYDSGDFSMGDVAVLVTKETFTLSRRVQPVCLDRSHTFDVVPGDYGYVVGWDSGIGHSAVLTELKIPVVNNTHCRDIITGNTLAVLTSDKLCAGYLDKGVAVCPGDQGGSLVFEKNDRFYLIGMLSVVPPTPDLCAISEYGIYTNVSQYVDNFISPKLSEYET